MTIALGLIAVVGIVPVIIVIAIARRMPTEVLDPVVDDVLPPPMDAGRTVELDPTTGRLAPVTPIGSARSARTLAGHPAAIAL